MISKTDAGVVVQPDPRQPDKTVTVPADQIASEIKTNVSEHINDADQFDDMTLMVMRFTKPRVLR